MRTMELVSIKSDFESITAYRLDTKEKKIWRGENDNNFVVQGEIFKVSPDKEWTFGHTKYIYGKIIRQHIDIPALGLVPLPVHLRISKSKEYEMEQVIPGLKHGPYENPIDDAIELRSKGMIYEALDRLMKVVKEDLRCIDGHVHLGNLKFSDGTRDYFTQIAIKHYTVGVELGNLFLGDSFSGKLPWGLIDNRPYLRALHGQCLSYWALNQFEEAERVANTLMKLNKNDNQGIRFILPNIKKKLPYKDFKQDSKKVE